MAFCLLLLLCGNTSAFAGEWTTLPEDSLTQPQPVQQETSESVSRGGIGFNPDDYLFQPRYVAKGDTFRHRFLDHLSLGFVTGVAQVAPKGGRSMDWGIPVGGMVGYEFNRLHGIRGSFFHTNYEMNDESGTVKQWEVDVDYMFNLTNYLYGYNRRRMFHVSPTVGLGYVHSTYQNEKASIFKGQVGVNVGVGLGRNARFFVEPFVSGLSDEADHSADENVSKFDIQYGVKAGLAVNLDNTNDYYNSEVVYTRGFFYEIAQGATFYQSDDLGFFKTAGTSYKIAVGRWFDPIVGLRLSATGSEYYWSYKLSQPSLSRGEYGWLTKYVPDTENGLKCNYAGFTGALTFLYNLDKETAVFVEPRVVVANFREPYVNVNREASFTETSAMIQAGFRVCAANRKERSSWGEYIFMPRFFTGLQVGGLKHMRSVNTVGDFALNYSGKFYLGYHLSRFATLKAAIEYETLHENKYDTYVVDFMGVEKQFTALWRYRYRFLNFKLAYMLNLSNIYQKYDLKRKFNLYVEAGALYTKCQSDGAEIYSGELEVGENPRPMSGKRSSNRRCIITCAKTSLAGRCSPRSMTWWPRSASVPATRSEMHQKLTVREPSSASTMLTFTASAGSSSSMSSGHSMKQSAPL